MPFDSDVALVGTGVAPLIAASHLLSQGKSILLLNPDWDFFLENSELSLDPLLHEKLTSDRLAKNSPEKALEELRPDFPGAIEFWSPHTDSAGYHDREAPHVRQRGRLWISSLDRNQFWNWEELEDLYVESSDAGLNPQILEGLAATRRFPGFSAYPENYRGLFIPKLYDVDTLRYRHGLLEFIRERLGPEKAVCAVNQVDLMPEGIRFHAAGSLKTARIREGILVFWTPKLSPWVMNQAKKFESQPKTPRGIRLWEEWSINSRESPDPGIVGMFGDMAIWADFEGTPSLQNPTPLKLTVLRSGPLITIEGIHLPAGGMSWASANSFGALSHLCHNFLRWDRFSIRSLKTRTLFEWQDQKPWILSHSDPLVHIIPGCDGPLVEVVRAVRSACTKILGEN
jgi:hypothetical protein